MNADWSKAKTFDEWFESLTPEEQKDYVEEMEADRVVDEYKSGFYD